MKLNYNSISAKVYRDFYNTYKMPESLCPYFWKLLFAWPITIILAPLAFPFWIMERVNKDSMDVPTIGKAIFSAVFLIALFLIFCLGVFISSYWITYYEKTQWYDFFVAGAVTFLITCTTIIVLSIFYLINFFKERQWNRRHQAVYDENGNWIPEEDRVYPKGNIIIEFIRATYNKYCPKIDWNR